MMKRKGKGLLIMLALCTMTTLSPVIITLMTAEQVMISLRNNIFTIRAVDSKIILFWTKFYGIERWNIDAGEEKCGPYACTLTYDKSIYENASAIMFHHRSSDWLDTLPTNYTRKPWQRWVLYNRESSWWTPKGDDLNVVNDLFNWTIGFRRDNDITIPTAVISRKPFKEGFDPHKNYLLGKTNHLVGLMSACIYYDRYPLYDSRRQYIEYLEEHGLQFDMYGQCGEDCGGNFSLCSEVLRNYKFVVAFENSLCEEYISEKPYRNGLLLGVIPVIMSGANLSDPYVLPPGSFIDAGKFSSVSTLVAFLQEVGTDPNLYNKYFEWQQEWDIQLISENEGQEEFSKDYFCPLCIKLHEDTSTKFIRNFREWYEQEKCKEYPTMNP